MKLHIAPPNTEMAADVLRAAQQCADLLDKTQFIVMERRTWERLMPTGSNALPSSARPEPTKQSQPCADGRPNADAEVVAAPLEADTLRFQHALQRLVNEVGGFLGAYEPDLRHVAGNTNVQCLKDSLVFAERELSAPPPAQQPPHTAEDNK